MSVEKLAAQQAIQTRDSGGAATPLHTGSLKNCRRSSFLVYDR
jgi:hypothetical protein